MSTHTGGGGVVVGVLLEEACGVDKHKDGGGRGEGRRRLEPLGATPCSNLYSAGRCGSGFGVAAGIAYNDPQCTRRYTSSSTPACVPQRCARLIGKCARRFFGRRGARTS